ncbi:PDCD5-related protein [Melampsora americana]|nr:PDCD5-related protein [Melampsora americana]
MADADLEAIRQKRLADLTSRSQNGVGDSSGIPPSLLSKLGGTESGEGQEDAVKLAQKEEMRRTAVSQIMNTDARERLARIALVRPQKAREIEDMLLRMAQSGQLRGQVSEDQLIGVLDQIERAEAGWYSWWWWWSRNYYS